MAKRDYYEILGVGKNASKDDIKKSYRKLAMKHHPDRNPNDKDAEFKFKEASEAAQVLLDEQKRSRYDQFGHAGVDGQAGFGAGGFEGFSDLGDIFGDIFGDFFGQTKKRSQGGYARAGDDLQMSINVDFKEAIFGAKKDITIKRNIICDSCGGNGVKGGGQPSTCSTCGGVGEVRRQQGFFTMATTCPQCRGTGQMITNPCRNCHGGGLVQKDADLEVTIPAGIDEGQRLKLSGEGDAGMGRGPAGDLYLVINVRKHEIFTREGFDVHCVLPISFSQAALGAELKVPTLDGRVALRIPQGTQSGRKMRLKNKGIKRLGSYGQGDQIVQIHVETPTSLSAEQMELFRKLSDYDDKTTPMGKSFFEKVKNLFH
ncbi:MAG: molecular chaperone DnaJ [Halobacteriovoraceae bacterium]|nr:molecular chaperone DnaJ [Halobacteriovoraceae bacterium]